MGFFSTFAIESGTFNVVMSVNCPDKAPWRMRSLIAHFENIKQELHGWSISHTLKEANGIADKLAKSGVSR
ncbi:hypothetical protein PTKIN_Ptkin16aG0078900 [Pterospermum kingtungense]